MTDIVRPIAIRLRSVRESDDDLLLEWVNGAEVLAIKHLTRQPISQAEHAAWMAERLADPDTLMFMIENGGKASGQVRLQKRAGMFEVDIYVVPEQRRDGLAKAGLNLAIERLFRDHPETSLRARVRSDNMASRRLFESLDFLQTNRDGCYCLYTLCGPVARAAGDKAS